MNDNVIKSQTMLHRLCENIKALRRIFDLSIDEMASAVGVSKERLQDLESGVIQSDLEIEILIKIHKSFGVTPSEMLETNISQTVYDILSERGYKKDPPN